MATFNMESITAKCNAFIQTKAGKEKLFGVLGGSGVSPGMLGVDPSLFTSLALTLVRMIESAASMVVVDSVVKHISTASISEPVIDGNGKCCVEISFGGDMSRPSLRPDRYGGARNIVAIMNNGYSKDSIKYIRGYWHGDYVSARPHRDALKFIQAACDSFEAMYGGMYDVSVQISSEY